MVPHAALPMGKLFLVELAQFCVNWISGCNFPGGFHLISNSPEAKTGTMEPGCALAVFAGMYLKIYSCVSLGERAHWGLCTKPFVGWGRFHQGSSLIVLSPSAHPQCGCLALPWRGWGSACPPKILWEPLHSKRYKRFLTNSIDVSLWQ